MPEANETKGRSSNRSVLGLCFLTAFLDLAGFAIIFPLFPAMLEHYFGREGEASLIGRLVASLRGLAGDHGNADFLVQALFGGLLGSIYSVLQFAFAPVWGALSDRIGRRPTLLFTLAGTALSYLVWCFAGSFALLVVARLFGGLMAGNLSTVSAVIADVTSAKDRSKGMGLLGAGIGLGFLVGPAIGGLSAGLDLREVWPGGEELGLNPFSGAALIAFALSAFNLVWALRRFPETLPPEKRSGARGQERTANPLRLFAEVHGPDSRRVNVIYFLTLLAFSAMEFTLVFLAVERFAYTPMDNGYMFLFVGFLIAVVQGGAIRRLAPRYGELRLSRVGIALIVPGFLAVGWAGGQGTLYAGLACMAVGSALLMPCLSALVSRYTPEGHQGLALGTFRSAGSLARAIGPVLGGLLYWRLGSAGPYLLGAAFLVLPLALSARLAPPPASPEAA